jgi:exopolysaccharide biosynthesis polyprenyl glycosylphosphotransferase
MLPGGKRMFNENREIDIQLNKFLDALILFAAIWVSYFLRDHKIVTLDSAPEIPSFDNFLWIVAITVPIAPFLLDLQGFYGSPLEKSVLKSLYEIGRAGMWLVLILGLCVIFLKVEVPSRSVLILFFLLGTGGLMARDQIQTAIHLRNLRNGVAGEPFIFAGEPSRIQEILRSLTPAQRMEMRVVKTIDLQTESIDVLVEALHAHSVGKVVLAFGKVELDIVQAAIEACEIEGIEAWLNADFLRPSIARPTYGSIGNNPMLVFRATPELSWAMLIKTIIDKLVAGISLILLSPVFLAVAIAIRISSPGPIVFTQRRAGIYGQPFTMYKFRTMLPNAEALRSELESKNTMSGPVFKIDNDPRVTRIGKFLRQTSLDEIPQLLNVFRGEMSLVGPRPLPLYEVEKFESASHRRRLSMKPGITCLWQVRGRSKVTDFVDWVRMDLEYIDTWSLGLDLWILLRTVPVVLIGLGAK